jgi:hypothetical protein
VTGQPKPDLLFVTLIHQSLRADADRLVAATAAVQSAGGPAVPGLRSFFEEYSEQLCLHHSHEDDIFFPALQSVLEPDQVPFEELAGQHEALDADLHAVREGLTALSTSSGTVTTHKDVVDAMSDMAAHLGAHLALEEETVLPRMESAVPPATYKEMEAQARKRTPRGRARFLIPWLVAHADPDQQRALFRGTPPLRAIYLVNRHRYRVLDGALNC